jgi:outer membrane protein TolC
LQHDEVAVTAGAGFKTTLATLAFLGAAAIRGQPAAAPSSPLPIDLPTALRLADERNLELAGYVARVEEATARLTQARLLVVPTLRIGAEYDRHDGNIQETSGNVLDVERVSQFTGVGARIGVDIADAIFQPLLEKQNRAAVVAAADANRHQVFVRVGAAYLRVVQARAEAEIVERGRQRAVDLATLTADYAESGEGLLADAEMAAVQPLLWQQRRAITAERNTAATAELARLLHLPLDVELEPLEADLPLLDLFPAEQDVAALVERALAQRPETEQLDALVAAAEEDLSALRYGWFIPSIGFSYSAGEFGGAPGSSVGDTDDRDDLQLTLYWQLDGFGFGHRARTNEKRAQLEQVGLRREQLRDDIVAEIRAGDALVQSLRQQIGFAELAVGRAEQAYALHRERIYDQQGLPLEAMQAMQTLATAELSHLEVLINYDLAQIRLHTALGNPLDRAF